MSPQDIMTTHEVCRLLKIARQTLYVWIEEKKIKPWRQLGGRSAWFFLKKDVLKARDQRYKRT